MKYRKKEREYAEDYGATVRTVQNWKAQGAPLDDPAEMKAWIESRHRGPAGETPKNITDAKLRKLLLECDRLAFNNEVAKGQYVLKSEVQRDHIRIGAATRSALQRWRADAPSLEGLSAADIDRWIAAQIDKTCAELNDEMSALYQ